MYSVPTFASRVPWRVVWMRWIWRMHRRRAWIEIVLTGPRSALMCFVAIFATIVAVAIEFFVMMTFSTFWLFRV